MKKTILMIIFMIPMAFIHAQDPIVPKDTLQPEKVLKTFYNDNGIAIQYEQVGADTIKGVMNYVAHWDEGIAVTIVGFKVMEYYKQYNVPEAKTISYVKGYFNVYGRSIANNTIIWFLNEPKEQQLQ